MAPVYEHYILGAKSRRRGRVAAGILNIDAGFFLACPGYACQVTVAATVWHVSCVCSSSAVMCGPVVTFLFSQVCLWEKASCKVGQDSRWTLGWVGKEKKKRAGSHFDRVYGCAVKSYIFIYIYTRWLFFLGRPIWTLITGTVGKRCRHGSDFYHGAHTSLINDEVC